MLAQATGDTAKTFIEKLPEILRAAATNPLSFVALVVLALAILVYFLFRKSNEKIKLMALCVMVGCVLVLGIVVISKWDTPQPPPPAPVVSCKVNGFVYNADVNPAVGLQAVKLSYIASGPANATPVSVATTSPNGHFYFDCSKIAPDAFPIHLRASHAGQIVESEDALVFADNAEVNLYISPRAVSNHYRLTADIMRIPSAQLLRNNFVPVTNLTTAVKLNTKTVATVPKNVRLSREAVSRLRTVNPR